MAESLFGSTTPGGAQFLDGSPGITTAVSVYFDVPGTITHVRFYCGAQNGGTWTGSVWEVTSADNGSGTGTLLGKKDMTSPATLAWNEIALDPPISVSANTLYRISIRNGQYYWAENSFFSGHDEVSGNIHANHNGDNPTGLGTMYQGSFVVTGTPDVYPNQVGAAANYAVDLLFEADEVTSSWFVYNGSTEDPATVTVWNGTSEVPMDSFEIAA